MKLTSQLAVGRKIGNGHFGEVFEGVDPARGAVAVKVLTRGAAAAILGRASITDAEWAQMKDDFLHEARNLAKATHRNVVTIYHVVESDDGGSILFCMELCSGGSLQDQFEKGPLSLKEVRDISSGVLLGLDALHRREMIHRDIKPGNILIGDDRRYKVSDFGLVTDELILGYGSQAGYSDHIAYEIWHGSGTSVASDIWAFGMTVFRLLHGRTWWNQLPPARTLVPAGNFIDTLQWLPHVPKEWRRALRKMMHDDRRSRYANATQVMNAIAQLPIEPSYSIDVSPEKVEWSLITKGRKKRVEWIIHSPRKHEWSAWSEPLGKGRTMSLGGSGGVVGKTAALKGLENYFL